MDVALKLLKLAYKRIFKVAAVEYQPALEQAKQNVPPQTAQYLDQIGQIYYDIATADLDEKDAVEKFYLKALRLREMLGDASNTLDLSEPTIQQFLGTITQGLQEEIEFVDEEYKKPDLMHLQEKYDLSDDQVNEYIETFVELSEPEQLQQEHEMVQFDEKMQNRLQHRKEVERASKQKQRAQMSPEQRQKEKEQSAKIQREQWSTKSPQEKREKTQKSQEFKKKNPEKAKEYRKREREKAKAKKLDELLKRRGLI